ncbi:MAG: hypothetical protein ACHQ4G_09510, partial [Opitutales bacterium]
MHTGSLHFHPGPHARDLRRGSVILFVLGLVLLTALLLTRFIERANTELLVEARTLSQVPLRDEAYAELQVALAVLADYAAIDNGLHSPAQGWGDPLAAANYTPPAPFQAEVRVEDESAKLSLARIDAATLQKLLVALGCLPTEAERISDGILAWTRPDYAAQFTESDAATFAQLDPPLVPPRVALRSWAELRLLPAVRQAFCDDTGNWNPLGRRFLANVSLVAFDRINLNTAGREVLDAAGVDADEVLALRKPAAGSKSSRSAQIFYTAADLRSSLGTTPDAAQAGVDASCLRG